MKQKVLELIRQYTGKNHVKLTNSGNSAIFLSLLIAKNLGKEKVLIPDQGGWLTFKTFPIDLNFKLIKVKTDYGILDLDDLKQKIDSKSVLLITNMAGYFAQQPIEQISELCKQKKALFILDMTDKIIVKSDADIYVASSGEWKPLNLKYGGFIATDKKEFFENIDREYFLMFKFIDEKLDGLYKKLTNLKNRFDKLNKKIKNDLKNFDIIHRDKKGINVVVKFKNSEEKNKIIKYCKENNLEYTLCPRYIRVDENAVSIEVKRG